ncbi:hypothetical protein ACVGWT_20535, partial [Enterobacter hormaechei]
NNTLRLLPGGGARARAYRYVGRGSAAPPRNTNLKPNTTPTPGMMKKQLSLALVGPLVVSCFYKNGDIYKQPRVNETNRF